MSSVDTLQPTFSAPSEEESEELTFKLVVYDGEGPSEPDTVSVTVKPTLIDTQPNPGQLDPLSQVEATAGQLSHTFDSTLSQISDPASILKQRDLLQILPVAGLVIAVIGGTAAYAKHRWSKKPQHKGGNIAVITRGGIE